IDIHARTLPCGRSSAGPKKSRDCLLGLGRLGATSLDRSRRRRPEGEGPMTFRSALAAPALLGLVALSPFLSHAWGAGEGYVVNYRASPDNPWLEYTTTRSLAQARNAVAELEALGYRAEYVTKLVGPVYSAGAYHYTPGYTYRHTGGHRYVHYHFSHR